MLSDSLFRLRSLFRRKIVEQELDQELQFHLEAQVDKYIRLGLTREEAIQRSRIEFGGFGQVKEECRDSRGVNFIETVAQDIRYGLRMLRKSPVFTLTVILILAAGIGANTAIFSVVEAVLLRPLPFRDANRLVDVTEYRPGKVEGAGVPYPDYVAWKQGTTAFEEIAAYFLIRASNDIVLGGPSSAERARYSVVSSSFLSILGVSPALGHGFRANDDAPGAARGFLVSDALWHSMFGGDPHAIGKVYLLDGEKYTLIGVMPIGFDFPQRCGLWLPVGTLGQTGLHDRLSHPFHVLGRLRSGVTVAEAQAQIDGVQKQLAQMYPNTEGEWRVRAQALLNEITGDVGTSLLVLLAAVGFILLIACANVANLMLARASAREREFAIRVGLGAGPLRLLRQNLTETALIVGISVILAVALANWGLKLILLLTPIHLPRMDSFRMSTPVLIFLLLIAALTTIAVGLIPMLHATRKSSNDKLQSGQRTGGIDPHGGRLRNILIVSEVALSLTLLVGAGLMLRSFALLHRVNPGFDMRHLVTMKIALPAASYPRAQQTSAFFDRLLERLRSIPGVQDAALTTAVPLGGESEWDSFQVAGRAKQSWAQALAAEGRAVSANYFRTLRIPLVRGREFTLADAHNYTVIINRAMAKKVWPGGSPIGQSLIFVDEPSHPREIIGVVADVKSFGLGAESKPEMYTVYRGAWYMDIVLRTTRSAGAAASEVREQLAALDRGVPVYEVTTMDQVLRDSVGAERFDTFLLTLFATLALALATIGLYGVLAFTVSRRTREIGIRLALGARREQVFRLIIQQGMTSVMIGLGLGLVASLFLTRWMASLLYGVSAQDPLTFIGVTGLLVTAALLASCIPAWRAMRVDPMIALRYE